MAPRPLIGISAHRMLVRDGEVEAPHQVAGAAYVRAVRKAGGLPVLLPVVEPEDAGALLERVDGLLMTGGADVDPATYGAERDERTVRVDAERDARDVALCRVAAEREVPTLAVCRGSQILSVAFGGTLVQHIDDHFDLERYNEGVHRVKVEPGSALESWLGATEIEVNTLHHQAVLSIGEEMSVTARAEDGTIEGVELSERIVGVQWHPELLRHRAEHLVLFETLVRLADR